ncbi:hypothetical protein TNCV_1739281 [Trichonephila clavipes]|nr:hypothetical protein TNCV_1739281 [Trichonephila clavipes]
MSKFLAGGNLSLSRRRNFHILAKITHDCRSGRGAQSCVVSVSSSPYRRASFFICATETSRNITARVIERCTSREIYYFLEDSRGFRTRQQGHQ